MYLNNNNTSVFLQYFCSIFDKIKYFTMELGKGGLIIRHNVFRISV